MVMRHSVRRRIILGAGVIFASLMAALTWSGGAQAEEGALSPYLKGSGGFMSGYLPPQSGLIIVNPIYYHYDGTVGASVRNGHVEFGVDVGLNAGLLSGAYTTGLKIFGADYAVGAVLGWVWADISATLDAQIGGIHISQSENGFGDTLFTPLILGWHTGNLHVMASLPIYAPTGAYTTTHLSVGKNIWAFMPGVAVTWFDPMSGWDVDGAFTLVFQTNNTATDYQSGDLFHLDWAIGKHIGEWEIGVQGNFAEQFTDDSGTGARRGAFRLDSIGIGPAVNYSTMLGPAPLTFSVKWEPDVHAKNTFKGNVIMASLVVVL
jgi:hypothetical protein